MLWKSSVFLKTTLIRKLNKEMQEMGFQTIQGRIDTKFFYEHFYQTKDYERRNA